MARMLPDPTFHPSPTLAGEAPAERLAYVALLTPQGREDRRARRHRYDATSPGLMAPVVYEWVGLGLSRRAWINLDPLWAGASVVTGVLTPFL
jgi:hypothetical protein